MKFALLIFYAAGTLAAPRLDDRYPSTEVKDIECSGTRFRVGTTYEYTYGGETVNNVEGTTQQSTGLQVSTRVFITQLDCRDYHMRLADTMLSTKSMKDTSFQENAESAAFQESLEKNDLIFTMKGNTITTLRPHDTETTEALNIKRGILSTLQLDERATTETDVNGVCQYKINKVDGTIVKTKTLSECSDRAENEIGIQSSSIKTASDLKPLDSKSTCTYSLEGGDTIRSVMCDENHLFRPFSAGYKSSSGAMTIVKQEMQFRSHARARLNVNPNTFRAEKSLLFDHTTETAKEAGSLNEQVEVVIQRLIDQSHLSAKKTSAQEFTSLVMLFRKMSRAKMAAIWDKYFDCKTCGSTDLKDLYRQYMLDAIAYCGTPSCISVVKDVTIRGEVAGERANMFLQSIALVAKTTNSMIRDILDIAKQRPSRQVYLTLGTLISRHCAKSPADCDLHARSAVIQAENFLERTLGDCEGQDDHERVEQILITLKAIGNAKRPTNVRSALIRCANSSIHRNITVSAFDALRGMPCDSHTLQGLRRFIADEDIDADKRIYAFQAAMKCPLEGMNLELLVQQYNTEKNNQLASFMLSYFTNLLESSDPDNIKAQELLAKITRETPLKKHSFPMYEYSKYFEKSIYIDSLETGATAKANLVFHPDGFLPKTAMFDMTAKVMGVPVELVETVVGIDGMETVLENAFGSDGVLPKEFNVFNWKFSTEKLKKMVETQVKRKRREAQSSEDKPMLNDIHDAIDKKPTQPSGFMTLKVMGQEVRVMTYDDIYALIDQVDNMNVIQLLLNWAKGGKKTFSKSMMFLEMTHTVPTGLGLPLRLKLTGSTVGTVELNGKFDIRSMLWGPAGLNINGFVKPTAVVDISGNMGIDSTFVSTGLLVSSNMMVSNMLKGSIIYKEGEILKINLDTPEKPVQLFHMSSTPFMFMNEKVDMIEGVPSMIKTDKCLKSELIGYGLCASVRVPVAFRNYEAPYFPLSGPSHVGLSLVRGDDRLTTFQFLTTMRKGSNGVEGVIEFSTPGAAYERRLGAKLLYTDINNDKVLTLSTSNEVASITFSYNGISHTTSIEARNNILKKEMVARIGFFNRTSEASAQFGIHASAGYDWYKFIHECKYVKEATAHSYETMTEYAPNKVMKASLKYDVSESKLKAMFKMNQIEESLEVTGKFDWADNSKGLTLALLHPPTGKTAKMYAGYLTDNDKQEIVTSAVIMGTPVKNILGWYRDGEKQIVENFFLFDQQSAKFDLTYLSRSGMKELQMNANVFQRTAFLNALYADRGEQKIIRVIADVLGKRASANAVITDVDVEKSIRIAVNAAGEKNEVTLGYYHMKDLSIFKIDGEILGRKAELYWKLKNTGGYQSTFGAVVDKYVAALKYDYSGDATQKNLCSTVYYGTTQAEKVAAEACIKLNIQNTGADNYVRAVCSLELPTLGQKLSLLKDITSSPGRTNIAVNAIYNDKVVCTKRLNFLYANTANAAFEFDVEIGRYTAGWKAYIQRPQVGAETDIGLRLKAMGNSLLFLSRYNEKQEEGETSASVTSSISVNGKEWPVTTAFEFLNRNGEAVSSLSLKIGEHSVNQIVRVSYGNSKYGVGFATVLLKGNQRLSGVFVDSDATVTDSTWALDNMFGFYIRSKEYKYGWHVEYQKQSVDMRRVQAIVHYATNRFSTVTVMFENSAKRLSAEMDVEYIPSRKVSHFVRYHKETRQLDASVELLPKMFAKFTADLRNQVGYTLATTMNLKFKDFSRVLDVVYKGINNDKSFMVSATLAGELSIAIKINKMSPKSLSVTVTAFGNTAELIAAYHNMQCNLDLFVNQRNIIKLGVSYDLVSKSVRMFARRGEKMVLNLTSRYSELVDAFNMALSRVKYWVSVQVNNRGEKKIVIFKVKNKVFAKVILSNNELYLQFKSSISYLLKYKSKSNTVEFSIKTRSNRITFAATADWTNKLASVHALFNKERFGIKVFLMKNSLNIKMIATPLVTMKTVFSYDDDTLSMIIQRITKAKVTDEASFKYTLSKKTCDFLFNWNTKTVKKIVDFIKPLVQSTVKDAEDLLYDAWENTDKVVAMSKEARTKILNIVTKVEKRVRRSLKDVDVVAARDAVRTLTLDALRKLSTITVKALNALATVLDNIKDGMPETVRNMKRFIKDIKMLNINLDTKAKELIATANMLITQGKELIRSSKETLATLKIDENLREFLDVVTKVTADLTEATGPVVKKAISLLKNFRIRGERMEDILKMATTKVEKLVGMVIDEATTSLDELKVKATMRLMEFKAACIKATDFIMKLKVPYTDTTIVQLIETIKIKIIKLKTKIETMDAKAFIVDMKATLMDYTIKGKTVTQYVNDVKAKFNELRDIVMRLVREYKSKMKDLPEETRRVLHNVVVGARTYINAMDNYIIDIKIILARISESAEPLVNHLMLVKSSIYRHFGPLVKEVVTKIVIKLNDIELPSIKPIIVAELNKISDFFTPLLRPLAPVYKNLLVQLKELNVMGFKIGTSLSMVQENMRVMSIKAKETMNEQMERTNMLIRKLKEANPEQIIDTSIDTSVRICNELVDYLNALETKARNGVVSVYNKMNMQYEKITSKYIEEVIEEIINRSSDKIVITTGELSNLIKQVVAMDISKHTWKAWTDADVLGHLERSGIKEKLRTAMKSAKDANIENIISDTIGSIEVVVNYTISRSSVKALEMYRKLHILFNFLKSIPKRDYETLLKEMSTFTLSSKDALEKSLNAVYEESRVQASKAYQALEKMAKDDASRLYNEHYAVAGQLYNTIAEKSQLVYSDVRQPTIDIYTLYRDSVDDYMKWVGEAINKQLTEGYENIYAKMTALRATLDKVPVKKMYADFIAKYGDLTCGEIATKIEKFVLKQLGNAKEQVVMQLKETREQIVMQYEKILTKSKEIKRIIDAKLREAFVEYKKIVVTLKAKSDDLKAYVEKTYNDIKPKVIEAYKKYEQMVEMGAGELMVKAESMYAEAKGKATDIYNLNKDKTLKQIYNQIKKFVVENYLKQREFLKAMADKNFEKANALLKEANDKVTDTFQKMGLKIRTIIVPELMAEAESIINQTLRNTVAMTKEIIRAYTPLAISIRNAAETYIEIIKEQAPVLLAKAEDLLMMDLAKFKEMLKLTITKIEEKIKQVIEIIKKNPKFVKYVAILEDKLTQLKDIINEKVLELKANPSLLKLKTEIEARVVQLRMLAREKLEEVLTNPKVKKAIEVLETRLGEYQTKVEEAILLLKQVQKSGRFTAEQLQKNLKPYLDTTVMEVRRGIAAVPMLVTHGLQYFADAPEDAFWYGIEVWREAIKGATSYAQLITKQDAIDALLEFYGEAATFSKALYTKSTDEWTKKTAKKLYDEGTKIYSEVLEEVKGLTALMKALFEKNWAIIEEKIATLKSRTIKAWANEVVTACRQIYENYGRDIIENPIWGEIADEVAMHELTTLSNELEQMVTRKVTELIEKYLPILKGKFSELKEMSNMNIEKIKTETLALYNKLIEKYASIINKAEKIFEETTLSDIVAFVEKMYKQAVEEFDQLKVKLDQLKGRCINKAKELFSNCKAKAIELFEEYKGQLMPYYVKLMDSYSKYRNELVMKTKELVEKVITEYKTLSTLTEAKYREIAAKILDFLNKYKTKAMQEMKKARETLTKIWNEIRGKIMTCEKWTIREIAKFLEELPATVYNDLVSMYKKYFTDLEQMLNDVRTKLEAKVEMIRKLKPYEWLENEITETAKFTYAFYGLEPKYNKMMDFIVAETMSMIRTAQNTLPMVPDILRRYAETYKTSLKIYATEYLGEYKKLLAVGDNILRQIHAGLTLVDSVDIENIKTMAIKEIEVLMKKLSNFVEIKYKNGELSIKVIHPNTKEAVVYYVNLTKQTAQETIELLNVNARHMLEKVKVQLDDIKVKANRLRVRIQKAIMRNTAEIRRDFNISFKVNKNIAARIYKPLKYMVMRNYRSAKAQYDVLERKALALINDVKSMSKIYYQQLALASQVAYDRVERMVNDIANSKSPKEIYEIIKKECIAILEQYKPIVAPKLEQLKASLTSHYRALERLNDQFKNGRLSKEVLQEYMNRLKKLGVTMVAKVDKTAGKIAQFAIAATEAYYDQLGVAYEQLNSGIPATEVFAPLFNKLHAIYSKLRNFVQQSDFRRKLCGPDPELCKLVDESLVVQKMLLTKYIGKATDYISTTKAHVDRAVRKLNKVIEERNIAEKYIATAMIMGDYILTFDNQLYNFVDFVKNGTGASPCKYLLARDFLDKKFTLIKSDGAIIVETPDMAIKIREDGRTKTTIGNKVSTSLPVAAGSSECVRVDNLILCHFKDQRMKITVDLKNLFTIISISGWYRGKSRGLLGTFNKEAHDEWRLPTNKITKNVNEFVNAYELSGDRDCKLQLNNDHTNTCLKPTSKKCKTYFASADSPFGATVDPKPFMEICKQATKCSKRASSKAHCSVVAAYVATLRTKGVWVSQPNECMTAGGRDVNEEWVQKPMKKDIDVVVMVSQKESMYENRKRIAATMYQLHKSLKADNFKVRYALIGFGGAGIHEAAHIHPSRRGQTVFGYILDLVKVMKNLPTAGKGAHTNDGYNAILMASQLKFRAGAEKAFIMFNSEPHSSHESGPSLDETKYILQNEANAPLFVFDTITFPNFGHGVGRVLGETARKLYTTEFPTGRTSNNLELPASEFKSLVLLSKGGLFSNTAYKKPKQAANSLHDAVTSWINMDIQVCKRCVLRSSWTGQSRAICVPDSTVRCQL